MNIKTLIEHATPEESAAIRQAFLRAQAKPAVVVTIDRKRYVVAQEDEKIFEGLQTPDLMNSIPRRSFIWFGGQWLRGFGRVDEMYRSLPLGEVTKIERIDRQKVWGH